MGDFDYELTINPTGQIDDHLLREFFEDIKIGINDNEDAIAALTGGKVLQVVTSTTTTQISTTSSTFQNTNLAASITPASTSNKILAIITGTVGASGGIGQAVVTLKRGATNLELNVNAGWSMHRIAINSGTWRGSVSFSILDSPSTTSSTTYTVALNTTAGITGVFPAQNAGVASGIILLEIAG